MPTNLSAHIGKRRVGRPKPTTDTQKTPPQREGAGQVPFGFKPPNQPKKPKTGPNSTRPRVTGEAQGHIGPLIKTKKK
jgi:hypothetical protein